ncbi:MAG: hypothetical protein AAF810_01330 [Cyanobacteria bacterium P01_D01_bin.36]
MSNKHTGIAVFSTGAVGVLLTLGINASGITGAVAKVAGITTLFAAIGVGCKESVSLDKTFGGYRDFYAEGVAHAFKGVASDSKIIVSRLPEPAKSIAEALIESLRQDSKWFDEFQTRSHLVTGQTNAGKTVFAHFEVAWFFDPDKNNGQGTLRICDINYGKRDHTYHGLPKGSVVYTEPIDLETLIIEAYDVLEARRAATNTGQKTGGWDLHRVVVDEFNDTMQRYEADMGTKAKDRLLSRIKTLLVTGHGYNVIISLNCQTLAVGEIGLSEAQQAQMFAVIFGENALNSNEVSKIASMSGETDGSKGLINQVKNLRRLPGGSRAGLLKMAGSITPVIPPSVSEMPIVEISAELLEDESQVWLQSVKPGAEAAKTEGLSLTQAWQSIGEGKQESSNPRYQTFKTFYEAA